MATTDKPALFLRKKWQALSPKNFTMCLIFYRYAVLGITEKSLPATKFFVVHTISEKLISVCAMKPGNIGLFLKFYQLLFIYQNQLH